MWRFWIMLLAVLGLLASPAAAAELEGFGPIKFGMTKGEAMAAIDHKGEWIAEDVLRYEIPFNDLPKPGLFVVEQHFASGRAAEVAIRHVQEKSFSLRCLSKGMRFAAEIRNKYGKVPTVRYGVPTAQEPDRNEKFVVRDIYVFEFGPSGMVQILVAFEYDGSKCSIDIDYRNSDIVPVPF